MRRLVTKAAFVNTAFAAALLVACQREEVTAKATARPSASVAAAPVQSSAPPSRSADATKAVLTPELEASPGAREDVRNVTLVVKELGLRESLGEVAYPNTCSGYGADDGARWIVSCTPEFRAVRASVTLAGSDLALELKPKGAPATTKKLPTNGRELRLTRSVVEPRAAACGEVTKKPLDVSFLVENYYPGHEPHSPFRLRVGKQSLLLTEKFEWWRGCEQKAENAEVTFNCPKSAGGRVWLDSAAVRFEWRERERFEGEVLLDCDREPKLVPPKCLNCNVRYF